MKYASIIFFLLTVALWTGCSERDCKEPPTPEFDVLHYEAIVSNSEPLSPSNTEKPASHDEARCRALAEKWVKEAEDLAEDAAQYSGGLKSPCLNPDSMARALLSLARLQAELGDMTSAKKHVACAVNAALRHITEQDGRNALSQIIAVQAEWGLFDDAWENAMALERVSQAPRCQSYRPIISAYLYKKDFAGAKEFAEKVRGRELFAAEIGEAEMAAGLYADASRTIMRMPEFSDYQKFGKEILQGRCAALLGSKDSAQKHFDCAIEILRRTEMQDDTYGSIARAMAESGMLDEAIAMLEAERETGAFYVLLTLAELKHHASEKKEAADLLVALKEVVVEDERIHLRPRRLAAIAVLQSRLIGKYSAWLTIQQGWKEYHNLIAEGWRYAHLQDALWLLDVECQAGFLEEATMRAIAEFPEDPSEISRYFQQRGNIGDIPPGDCGAACRIPDEMFCTKEQALGLVAVAYARAGQFGRAHRIVMAIDWTKPVFVYGWNGRYSYINIIGQVANLAIEAGATEYVPDLVDKLVGIDNDNMSKCPMIAQILSRGGFEERLDRTYATMQDGHVVYRYNFCISAAQGYLKRIDDMRAPK